MFHSTISPTASNETFSLSSFGRNVNDPLASESKNQSLFGKGQESRDPASNAFGKQMTSFSKEGKVGQGEVKNENNFDRFGLGSGDKNTVKDSEDGKIAKKVEDTGNAGESVAEKRKR